MAKDTFFVGGSANPIQQPQQKAPVNPLAMGIQGASKGFLSTFTSTIQAQRKLEQEMEKLSQVEEFEESNRFTPEELGLDDIPEGLAGKRVIDRPSAEKMLLDRMNGTGPLQSQWMGLNTDVKERIANENPEYMEFLKNSYNDANTTSRMNRRTNSIWKSDDFSAEGAKQFAGVTRTIPMMKRAAGIWKDADFTNPSFINNMQRWFTELGGRGTGLLFRSLDSLDKRLADTGMEKNTRGKFVRYMNTINRLSESELRKATGAATNMGEKIDYNSFMPLPGDSATIVEDKLSHLIFAVQASFDRATLDIKDDPTELKKLREEKYLVYRKIDALTMAFVGKHVEYGIEGMNVGRNDKDQFSYDPIGGQERKVQQKETQRRKESAGGSAYEKNKAKRKSKRGRM